MYQTYAHKKPIVKKSDDEPRRRYWKWLLLLPLLLVLFFGWRAIASSRNLAKVKSLQEQMATATPEQRPQLFQDMRSAMANLTSAQRDLLFQEGQKRQEQELDRYLAMSKSEQKNYLDERINRIQKMRANTNAKGNQKGGTVGPGQGLPAGATAAAGFGSGKGFGGPAGKSKSPDEIESRKKKGLDRTSVDLRAKNDRFRKDLEARMRERGISIPSGGRR
jgi:hypothetical protein